MGFETNPIVFMDVEIGEEKDGRIILELFKEVAPKTAENFRALCTGEMGIGKSGKPLCYKGTIFHKAVALFMIQGGDITNNDGTGGESIYGHTFADETFEIKHSGPGILSMANYGPNTNGSQFFITTVACPHLDGINVAFGRVLAGMGIVVNIAEQSHDGDDRPQQRCVIANCGEIPSAGDWHIIETDGTEDTFPPYPEDWKPAQIEINYFEDVVTKIKNSGNYFFNTENLIEACRKYKKGLRYIKWIRSQTGCLDAASTTEVACHLNLAATQLRRCLYREAVGHCDAALLADPTNVKALFRRARALRCLGEYQAAFQDLRKAESFHPGDPELCKEEAALKSDVRRYGALERIVCGRMFQ